MTYFEKETSRQNGRPVELFQFTDGNQFWRYCTGDDPIVYLGNTYAPATIVRGATEASQEFGKSQMQVRIPADLPLAKFMTSQVPNNFIGVTLFRTHVGDTEFITHWRGRVISSTWRNHECTLTCEPVFTGLQRAGLRALYQRPCRHAIYSPGCGVDKALHALETTVDTAVKNQVFVTAAAGFPSGYFTGGMLKTDEGSRAIMQHIGHSLTLITPIAGLTGGREITLYPGCDHTFLTCKAKFDNGINFGGQPWLPQKNPFTGDGII